MSSRSQAGRIAFLEAQVERLTALVERMATPVPRVVAVRAPEGEAKDKEPALPSIVREAVKARGVNDLVAAQNQRFASRMLAEGADANDVARAIIRGAPLPPDPLEIPS